MQRLKPTGREKTELARWMRKHPTLAERVLWRQLRNCRLGVKFKSQRKLAGYILDFACHERKLAIEVDGSVHDARKEYDDARDFRISTFGWRTLRFQNEDVFKRMPWVISRICEALGVSDAGVRAPSQQQRRKTAARISGGDLVSQRRRWSRIGERIKKSNPFNPTPRLRKTTTYGKG